MKKTEKLLCISIFTILLTCFSTTNSMAYDLENLDATPIGHTIPGEIYPGDVLEISITMKNTGSVSWTSTDLYRLLSLNTH